VHRLRENWLQPVAVDTVICAPDDGWKYHPKHVEQFPDINGLCNVASCWIYIGILLGAHPILHISRIRVKREFCTFGHILLTLLWLRVFVLFAREQQLIAVTNSKREV
jgi:hypothetical protein